MLSIHRQDMRSFEHRPTMRAATALEVCALSSRFCGRVKTTLSGPAHQPSPPLPGCSAGLLRDGRRLQLDREIAEVLHIKKMNFLNMSALILKRDKSPLATIIPLYRFQRPRPLTLY